MKIYLAKIRQRQHLSVRQLAYLSGVSKTHINAVENGETSPTIDVVCRLAKALKVSPCDIFDCDER